MRLSTKSAQQRQITLLCSCVDLIDRLGIWVVVFDACLVAFILVTMGMTALVDPGIIPRNPEREPAQGRSFLRGHWLQLPVSDMGFWPKPRSQDVVSTGKQFTLKYCGMFRALESGKIQACRNVSNLPTAAHGALRNLQQLRRGVRSSLPLAGHLRREAQLPRLLFLCVQVSNVWQTDLLSYTCSLGVQVLFVQVISIYHIVTATQDYASDNHEATSQLEFHQLSWILRCSPNKPRWLRFSRATRCRS